MTICKYHITDTVDRLDRELETARLGLLNAAMHHNSHDGYMALASVFDELLTALEPVRNMLAELEAENEAR